MWIWAFVLLWVVILYMSIVLISLDAVCFSLMGLSGRYIFGGSTLAEARKDTPCKEAKSRWNPKQERMSEHVPPAKQKYTKKSYLWFLLWDLMHSIKSWPRLRQRSHGNTLKLPQNPGHGVMCSSCWRLAGSKLTKRIHPTICWPWNLLASDSWILISVAPDTWQSPPSEGIGELNVTFGAVLVVLDCLPFVLGEGTAMFFFAFVFHLALGKLDGWRLTEQEGKVIRNVDALTFPVSVLVFPEYYFILKFKWKSEELWDCFC